MLQPWPLRFRTATTTSVSYGGGVADHSAKKTVHSGAIRLRGGVCTACRRPTQGQDVRGEDRQLPCLLSRLSRIAMRSHKCAKSGKSPPESAHVSPSTVARTQCRDSAINSALGRTARPDRSKPIGSRPSGGPQAPNGADPVGPTSDCLPQPRSLCLSSARLCMGAEAFLSTG